ncbi:MAG TPA: hypothetical protein VHU89_15990 [Acidobacteriaceae bacterium]|jgi:hypothetical protein|nr:hypothetical protein [Acidobacteriaceae bacterium]
MTENRFRMQFSDYLGQKMVLIIPLIDPVKSQEVTILGVEAGGVWVESATLMSYAAKSVGSSATLKSLVFFIPYHEIRFGFVSIDKTFLDENALGL